MKATLKHLVKEPEICNLRNLKYAWKLQLNIEVLGALTL